MPIRNKKSSTVGILRGILEDYGTAQVLLSPSTKDQEVVKDSIEELPVEEIIRDLAIISANKAADLLQTMSLRPADYAYVEEVPVAVVKKIVKNLGGKGREFFIEVFRDHLKTRG